MSLILTRKMTTVSRMLGLKTGRKRIAGFNHDSGMAGKYLVG